MTFPEPELTPPADCDNVHIGDVWEIRFKTGNILERVLVLDKDSLGWTCLKLHTFFEENIFTREKYGFNNTQCVYILMGRANEK